MQVSSIRTRQSSMNTICCAVRNLTNSGGSTARAKSEASSSTLTAVDGGRRSLACILHTRKLKRIASDQTSVPSKGGKKWPKIMKILAKNLNASTETYTVRFSNG